MALPGESGMPRVPQSVIQGMNAARAAAVPVDGRAFGTDRGFGVYRDSYNKLTYKGTPYKKKRPPVGAPPQAAPVGPPPANPVAAPVAPPAAAPVANPVAAPNQGRVTYPSMIGGQYAGRGVQDFGMIGTFLNPVRNAIRVNGNWDAPGTGPGGTWQPGDPLSTDQRLWGQAGSAGNPSLFLYPRRAGFFGGVKPKTRRR
jgi:hypothetical protein